MGRIAVRRSLHRMVRCARADRVDTVKYVRFAVVPVSHPKLLWRNIVDVPKLEHPAVRAKLRGITQVEKPPTGMPPPFGDEFRLFVRILEPGPIPN